MNVRSEFSAAESFMPGGQLRTGAPQSPIEVACVKAFDFLSAEYRTLFDNSNATVFQSPFWLSTFYQSLAADLHAEPRIVVVRNVVDDRLLLVLPMVVQTSLGVKIMQPADLGISDYNALVGADEDLQRLASDPQFNTRLRKSLGRFDILFFRKQRPEAFDFQKLFPKAQLSPQDNIAYHVDVTDDFDEWYGSIPSKSFRKNMTRSRRKLSEELGPISFATAMTEEQIREAFQFLREMRGARYEDDLLKFDAYFNFYLSMALEFPDQVTVFTGRVGDMLLTAEVSFLEKDRNHLILGAFHNAEKFKRCSLGIQSVVALMQHHADKGNGHCDFTIGAEQYKQSLQGQPTPLRTIILTNSVVGQIAKTVFEKGGFIKAFLKRISPKLN